MKGHRFGLVALLLALVLSLGAVGCGGDDEEGENGTTTEEAAEDVSGNISILALWTAGEQASFKAVIDGFNEQYPNVTVSYRSAPDVRPVLSTAIEGGNPPDLAAVPNPGLMKDFQGRGALKPIEFARDTVEENFQQSWVDLASVEDQLYGVFFKGANKSTVWYAKAAFENAGIEPPLTGTRSSRQRRRSRSRACRRTRSAPRTAGCSPTCSRTSTCARQAPRSTTSSSRTRSSGRIPR